MALLRKINQALLFLLIVTVCGILYKKGHKGAVPKSGADEDSEPPEDAEDEIPVVICAAAGRMGATMAAINSIYSNTDANIMFYVVGLRNTLPRIRKWIEHSKLREINFKIVEFNPTVLEGKIRPDASRPELLQPLNFVRFYLPLLIHQHEKVIYLDDDVIVQEHVHGLPGLPEEEHQRPGHQPQHLLLQPRRDRGQHDGVAAPAHHQAAGEVDAEERAGKPVQQLPGRRRGYLTHAHRVPREILHHQPPVAHPAPGLESRRQVLGAFPAGSEATALGRAAQALAFPQRPCRLVGKLVRARPCGDIQTQSQQLTEPAAGTVCFSFVLFFFWYQESNSRPCTCQAGAVPLS
ncbi:PREDICTED: glycosyltransferase 8 domain-containing protein 2 isoform X7 [Chinchilla lanigera]|uniref:glycosyltransferase 8 domain-containing protein 2 isoform X7 n=1 Tax=Chinchilla lanigera TaxID=34839 RepID=UPI00038EB792|nr:PREDICTED: glycosyltransferase 8 domain-containing protein 2 isoform X7 [Chinchilla lanigera]